MNLFFCLIVQSGRTTGLIFSNKFPYSTWNLTGMTGHGREARWTPHGLTTKVIHKAATMRETAVTI